MRLISPMWLILYYTVQAIIPDVCTKFQNPRSSSSREIFDENLHIQYLGEIEKRKNKKEGESKSQHLEFVYIKILGRPHRVYKI